MKKLYICKFCGQEFAEYNFEDVLTHVFEKHSDAISAFINFCFFEVEENE